MEIDEKDKKIVLLLKENSRYSIRSIAKKTGIRPSTIHQRLQKLLKNNIIEKFTLKLSNKAVGENFIVFMLIKGKTTQYMDEKILRNAHVKEGFGVTGEYDLLLKLKFKDVEEFNDFIIKFRKEQKGVEATLTMVVTATIKEEI